MSSMPTPQEMAFDDKKNIQGMPRLGTVVALFSNPEGTPQIRFDGEENPSDKPYPYLGSYKPAIDDRVLLLPMAGTYIIIDKILFNVSPPASDDITVGNLTVTGNLNHQGSGLGFYNRGLVGKDSVTDPSTIATTDTAPATYTSAAQTMLTHLKTDVTNLRATVKDITDSMQWVGLG